MKQHLEKNLLEHYNLELFAPQIEDDPFKIFHSNEALSFTTIVEILKKISLLDNFAVKRITSEAQRNYGGGPPEVIPVNKITIYSKDRINLLEEFEKGLYGSQTNVIGITISKKMESYALNCLAIETYAKANNHKRDSYDHEMYFLWTQFFIWWID